MSILNAAILDTIKIDLDQREELIRQAVYEAMSQMSEPDLSENIVVSYFIWANNGLLVRLDL